MSKQKRVLLLGGNLVQQTATLAAKSLGYYIISVDYLPDNPAHKYADEYHNISTLDQERILDLAREKKIDGIVSYASDVSAPTAAYVAEQLGLPTNPYESVQLLTQKDAFRQFLKENGLPVPWGEAFESYDDALHYLEALGSTGSFGNLEISGTSEVSEALDTSEISETSGTPGTLEGFSSKNHQVIIKPVDSSGSKGVTILDLGSQMSPCSKDAFDKAWLEAMQYSRAKKVIIEEYIEKQGYQIDGDIFVNDGKIVFWGICNQHHDSACASFIPISSSYPPVQDAKYQARAKELIERILSLLHMTIGAYNVEYIVGKNGEVYILEIGPRNGGNMITDVIAAATGVNLAEYTIKQAVGDSVNDLLPVTNIVPVADSNSCACSFVIHSLKDGYFLKLEIADQLKEHVQFVGLSVKPGDPVSAFHNAGCGIGMMVLKFEQVDEMLSIIDHMNDYVQVCVTENPMPEQVEGTL